MTLKYLFFVATLILSNSAFAGLIYLSDDRRITLTETGTCTSWGNLFSRIGERGCQSREASQTYSAQPNSNGGVFEAELTPQVASFTLIDIFNGIYELNPDQPENSGYARQRSELNYLGITASGAADSTTIASLNNSLAPENLSASSILSTRFTVDATTQFSFNGSIGFESGDSDNVDFTLIENGEIIFSIDDVMRSNDPLSGVLFDYNGYLTAGNIYELEMIAISTGYSADIPEWDVELTAIPLPAGIWLFMSAMGLLAYLSRKHRAE